jgi:hypothetical protein
VGFNKCFPETLSNESLFTKLHPKMSLTIVYHSSLLRPCGVTVTSHLYVLVFIFNTKINEGNKCTYVDIFGEANRA